MKALLKLCLALILTLSLTACSDSTSSHSAEPATASTPEEVAKSFLEKQFSGDINGMFEMVYLKKKENENPQEVKEFILKLLEPDVIHSTNLSAKNNGVQDIIIDKVEYKEDSLVRVHATIHFNNNETKATILKFIQTDDGWKYL